MCISLLYWLALEITPYAYKAVCVCVCACVNSYVSYVAPTVSPSPKGGSEKRDKMCASDLTHDIYMISWSGHCLLNHVYVYIYIEREREIWLVYLFIPGSLAAGGSVSLVTMSASGCGGDGRGEKTYRKKLLVKERERESVCVCVSVLEKDGNSEKIQPLSANN